MKNLKITLGFLFVLQLFALDSFAKNTSEKIEDKKMTNNLSNCCLYWGGTKTVAVQVCGYGDQNCYLAALTHDFIMKGKIFVLTRRKK